MMLDAGQPLLNGKYRILRLIGEGAFARVWLAEEAEFNGRLVAIKELNRDRLTAAEVEELERRFRLEIELSARLEQAKVPNVVRALTVERLEDGARLLVMEYADGGSLADLIAGHPDGLPVEQAVGIALKVCRALEGFHKLPAGPIHRDVKPSNILLTKDGQARLSDFGLAQLPGASGRSHGQAPGHPGTPNYMAPEQARSPEPLMPAADLFALGCVLFEMLTGCVYKRVRPGTKPSSLRPEVPAWLDEALARVLVEDPWSRCQSAAELATTLEDEWTALTRVTAQEAAQRAEEERLRQEAEAAQARREAELARRSKVEETRLAELFDGALDAYQNKNWAQATVSLGALLDQRPFGYERRGWQAGNLMLEAQRKMAAAARQKRRTWIMLLILVIVGVSVLLWKGQDWGLAPATSMPIATPSPAPQTATATPIPVPTRTPSVTTRPLATTASPPSPTRPPSPTPVPPPTIGSTRISDRDGMIMVYMPSGEFRMGSDAGDAGAGQAEQPRHTVFLSAFWIDRTEVTNAMFARFVDATGYHTTAESQGASRVFDSASREWTKIAGASWRSPRGPGSNATGLDAHPVAHMTRADAQAYCQWAGRRLPTEAEWEKAARGTDGRTYPWGNQPPAGNLLNFADRRLNADGADRNADDGYQFTAPVGSFPAGVSPYGALDMAGNVWELVADWYDENYYRSSPSQNPTGPGSGQSSILRGGAWGDSWQNVRAATRFPVALDWSYDTIGFRCARDATP